MRWDCRARDGNDKEAACEWSRDASWGRLPVSVGRLGQLPLAHQRQGEHHHYRGSGR